MKVQLSGEAKRVLQLYAKGQLSNQQLGEWLVQIEYDEDVPIEERDELSAIRLVLIEAEEGLRPAGAVLKEVRAALGTAMPGSRGKRTASRLERSPQP